MPIYKALVIGKMKANCYIINDGNNVAVIDPGDEGPRIEKEILALSATPKLFILLTHGHVDHIGAVPFLIKKFPEARIFSGRAENLFLYDSSVNLSRYTGKPIEFTEISGNIQNVSTGDEITCGKYNFRVLETPGHTPGSLSFILDVEGIVFCGDLLFKESVGPTSLPFGDEKKLYATIEQRILMMRDSWALCPGHGEQTTIEHEKQCNPYINSITKTEDFI